MRIRDQPGSGSSPCLSDGRRSARSLALAALAALALVPAPGQGQIRIGPHQARVGTLQRAMVAQLTGLGREPGAATFARSSPAERAAIATFLEAALERLGLAPVRHEYRQPNVNPLVDLLLAPYRGTNVYTVVEATTPSREYIVVGAHYDSEPGSPGAGDNASGVSLVYALARTLSGLEIRNRNFLFVFFDQEEDDEVGSRAFVRHLEKQGFEVHSVHITDLSGWDEDGDGVIEVQSPGPVLEARYREAAERLGLELRLTQGASSDNKSFLAAGYPTVGVFGDITRHLHQASDTFETVDFPFLESMTTLMAEVLTGLGQGGDPDAP